MSWKKRKKQNKVQRKSRKHPRDRGHWPVAKSGQSKSKHRITNLLSLAAPAIEAAGSLQRAVKLNALHLDPESYELLKKALPVSRGGEIRHPNADSDWMKFVNEAVQDRNIDLDCMRARFASNSNNN